jgi:carbon monoxide dehydrogenase subunit G
MTPFANLVAAATLALAALPAAAANNVTENRDVSNFTALALAAPIRVDVTLGERETLVLEGEAEAVANLETRVENGKLRISTKPGLQSWGWTSNWHERARAKLTVRKLDSVSISGSGDVHASEVRGESLKIAISGSGDVIVEGGKVGELAVSISGSGDVRTAKMEAQRATVSISGSGDATVWASQALEVRVAGSGDVRYYGDPRVASHIAGSGSVKKAVDKPA